MLLDCILIWNCVSYTYAQEVIQQQFHQELIPQPHTKRFRAALAITFSFGAHYNQQLNIHVLLRLVLLLLP